MTGASTPLPRFSCQSDPGPVFRVGHAPDPWAWTDWNHASGGRFTGRWDSEDGSYRTLYAGQTVFGCLVETLARFRPDPRVIAAMADIRISEDDTDIHPTVAAGVVDLSWFSKRRVGRADLGGRYCDVTRASTIAALRDEFQPMATNEFGLDDFDGSALQNSRPRALTQRVGRFIFGRDANEGGPFDGVRFQSRHGGEIALWAIFEQPGDTHTSVKLDRPSVDVLDPHSADVLRVLELHGLVIG